MPDMLDDLYEDPQGEKSEEDYPSCPFLRVHSPNINDFVRFDRYKGKPRPNGKISLTADGNRFVLTVTDLEHERSCSISCYGMQDGLEQLEQLVKTRQLHWRYWGNRTAGKKAGKTGTRK